MTDLPAILKALAGPCWCEQSTRTWIGTGVAMVTRVEVHCIGCHENFHIGRVSLNDVNFQQVHDFKTCAHDMLARAAWPEPL